MIEQLSIGIIGCGNMGGAILNGLLTSNKKPRAITVLDPSFITVNPLVESTVSYKELLEKSDCIILAVKPFVSLEVLQQIEAVKSKKDILFISVIAGVSTKEILASSPSIKRIVRAMPNLAATLKYSATTIYTLDKNDFKIADAVFQTIGSVTLIENEALINTATGLAGSGPAFVFVFAEACIKAGIAKGFSAEKARKLTIETILGAGRVMQESNLELSELIKKVATPGGTTEAGLISLRDNNFTEIVKNAVIAAVEKAECNLSQKN